MRPVSRTRLLAAAIAAAAAFTTTTAATAAQAAPARPAPLGGTSYIQQAFGLQDDAYFDSNTDGSNIYLSGAGRQFIIANQLASWCPTFDNSGTCWPKYLLVTQSDQNHCGARQQSGVDVLVRGCTADYTVFAAASACSGSCYVFYNTHMSNDFANFYDLSVLNGAGDNFKVEFDGAGGYYQKFKLPGASSVAGLKNAPPAAPRGG